jgi:hypothetical protein
VKGAAWRDDGPAGAEIRQGGLGFARIFGIPFASAGAYFLYQFLGGVFHPGELTIAGWIMLPVFAALFLVPGWILLFGRKVARLDGPRREVTEEFNFLVYSRRVTTRVPLDAHVLLRYEKAGNTTYPAHVYIVPDANKEILIGIFPPKDTTGAFEFAQRAATLFAIDVQDRRVEGGEVTAGGIVVDHLGPEDAD